MLLPFLTKKFALFKLCDPVNREIFDFSVRKFAARLAPCKKDNPEGRKFNNDRAHGFDSPMRKERYTVILLILVHSA